MILWPHHQTYVLFSRIMLCSQDYNVALLQWRLEDEDRGFWNILATPLTASHSLFMQEHLIPLDL